MTPIIGTRGKLTPILHLRNFLLLGQLLVISIFCSSCGTTYSGYSGNRPGYLSAKEYETKARDYARSTYRDFDDRDFPDAIVMTSDYRGNKLYLKVVKVWMTRHDGFGKFDFKDYLSTNLEFMLSLSGRVISARRMTNGGMAGARADFETMMLLDPDRKPPRNTSILPGKIP